VNEDEGVGCVIHGRGEKISAYGVLVVKPERKGPLGRLKCRLENMVIQWIILLRIEIRGGIL
jgi:hypothetical protein